MAAILDQVSIATIKAFGDLNTQVLSRESPALRLFQENSELEEGDPISVPIRYKRNNGGSYAAMDQFNVTRVEQFAEGTLQWKSVYVNVTVDEHTLVRNASMNIKDLMNVSDVRRLPESSRKTIFNVFGREFEGALDDMRTLLANQLMSDGSGNGGKDMTGLLSVASNSTTASYAGIAGNELGTFDYLGDMSNANDNVWAARYRNAANESISTDMLADGLNDSGQGGADSVDWIFMPLRQYTSMALQLEGQKTRQNPDAAEIGFRQNVEWIEYGVTLFPDPFVTKNADTSGTVLGINKTHTKMLKHPALNMEFSGFKEPVDQAAITGQLKCFVQIYCNDRARNFRIDNVNP